ncbi:phosphatidate cytidylyltransferase, putative, partial [Plasmodium ovale curtisi]
QNISFFKKIRKKTIFRENVSILEKGKGVDQAETISTPNLLNQEEYAILAYVHRVSEILFRCFNTAFADLSPVFSPIYHHLFISPYIILSMKNAKSDELEQYYHLQTLTHKKFIMKNFEMINIVLTFLITITEVKKKVFLSSNYTYKWLVLTLLCNMLIVIWLYYDKRNNIRKGQLKWKSNFLFDTSTFALGGYYKKERLPNSPKGKNMNMIINLKKMQKKGVKERWSDPCVHMNSRLHIRTFAPFPFLGVAKLTLALINEFALSSVWLRYARVRIPAYVAFHAVLFPITISNTFQNAQTSSINE